MWFETAGPDGPPLFEALAQNWLHFSPVTFCGKGFVKAVERLGGVHYGPRYRRRDGPRDMRRFPVSGLKLLPRRTPRLNLELHCALVAKPDNLPADPFVIRQLLPRNDEVKRVQATAS